MRPRTAFLLLWLALCIIAAQAWLLQRSHEREQAREEELRRVVWLYANPNP